MPESPPKNTGAFAPFEWMIAARYLRAKRQESFISVISLFSLIGIALGVATLIIVMSVMNGFKVELLKSILGLSGHVTIQSQAGSLADYDRLAGRILKVPGVRKATPIVDGKVMASRNGYNEGAVVHGIRSEDLAKITELSGKLRAGSSAYFKGDDAVIVGSGLANKLGLHIGDEITLITPKGDITPFGATPRIKTYHIISLFRVGNTLYDNYYVFMPLDEAQAYFNYGDTVSGIEVMVSEPEADLAMLPALVRAAGPMTRAVPWQDINGAFFEVVQVERNVMFLILSLIVLVAALNIISGLIMLVKDKSADIAILRTMGATRGAVMRIFLIAGMSVGVAGTFLGFAVGVLFCANIESIRQALQRLTGTPLFDETVYFLAKMPATLDPAEVTGVVVMALTLSFLATLYPSWRAARLDPVEALRYE
ncbi:MAG TPA: lipoprotein-releasing ABC transporter permease subunit [Rhizomicrobium sp.]|nr:lipoprotein-releasing ABC transporter permease subunit [Rhizomicrobium sp.]